MDIEDARHIAETELARWNASLTPNKLNEPQATSHDPDDEYVVTKVETHSRAWIVHFATRRWVRTRQFRDMVVGTSPLVIDRTTGELHVYGSAQHAEFDAWRDSSDR